MAEIRKITCDVCGRDIMRGYIVASARLRHITSGFPDRGAYRFDMCDDCFNTLRETCAKKREEATE